LLLQLLDYNLLNFDPRRKSQNDDVPITLTSQPSIIDFLKSVFHDPELGFLHRLTAFVTINSFDTLYVKPSQSGSELGKRTWPIAAEYDSRCAARRARFSSISGLPLQEWRFSTAHPAVPGLQLDGLRTEFPEDAYSNAGVHYELYLDR
jgi:hypothetical protein